jgi:hypothetical protein
MPDPDMVKVCPATAVVNPPVPETFRVLPEVRLMVVESSPAMPMVWSRRLMKLESISENVKGFAFNSFSVTVLVVVSRNTSLALSGIRHSSGFGSNIY